MPTALEPRAVGQRVSRKRSWLSEESVADVEFGLACDAHTLDQAFRLVHDQYVWRGYMTSDPSGRRISLHNMLPTTRVFVAVAQGRVIGTVSVVGDSVLGLPMDEIYRPELQELRTRGRRLAEVSSLAMDPLHRSHGVAVLMRLMRMLVLYCTEIAHVTDVCIAVNPRHVDFYRKVLHFKPIGGLKPFAKVNGAPAVALNLDLDLVRSLISTAQATDIVDEFYDFFVGRLTYRRLVGRLERELRTAAAAGWPEPLPTS